MPKTKPRIVIYADPMLDKGGGSRVILQLAKMLKADIITTEYDEKVLKWMHFTGKIYKTGSFFPKNSPIFSLFESPFRFLFMNKPDNYDLHIFIGTSALFAARKTKNNIWFSFSPNRIMYDLFAWKMRHTPLFRSTFLFLYTLLFRPIDQYIVKRKMNVIVAQTQTVRERIKKYYDRDSLIIYSPVDVSQFFFNSLQDFFLTTSRLVPEKRIDLIIEAFNQMPDKKLIIVGNGIEKERLLSLIKNKDQIKILSNISDEELSEFYSNCMATIYMPIAEDFGLIPIESMASGKICVAANEGGCRETIIDTQTGFLIPPTVAAICTTILSLRKESLKNMKELCFEQAQKFDMQSVQTQWLTLINSYAYA